METSFFYPFAASLIAATVTTIGLLVIQRYKNWAEKNTVYFISFAAGVLISVSLIHIIPKSFSMNEHAPILLLTGFFSFHLLNRFIHGYVCHKATGENTNKDNHGFGFIPMIGIGLHSFIDGIVYSIAFSVSFFTGILAVIGLILHEFPEGVVTYVLLRKGGMESRKSFIIAFFTAALTTPLGVLISYPFIAHADKTTLGLLLAFSAGNLLYVGAVHLLPKIETEDRKFSILALIGGIIVALFIIMSK
ncbi:MAG: ZIP family metal transporter [Alphaproteobacteria bacterium]|nr:ZIP family metal transporter [Alphaproteobacteria bacterium]